MLSKNLKRLWAILYQFNNHIDLCLPTWYTKKLYVQSEVLGEVMGVTHKLNPEVLEYILQQKQANPGLGCRKLSELVSSRFQVNVSKSSVNNVLKEANLSNSVGRPSKKTKEKLKKFQIPSDKKKQISQELQEIPIPYNVQTHQADNVQTAISTDEDDSSNISLEGNVSNAIVPEKPEWGDTITMNYAGGMFYLAAFYETMDETLLGSLLSEYSQKPDRKQFEKKCNAALLMSSLDINDSTEKDILVREQADFDFSPDELQSFRDKETSDVDRILLQTKIDLELSQLDNYATGCTITLETGAKIYLSPFLSIQPTKQVNINDNVPLKSAVTKLSEEVLVNTQPLMFTRESSAPSDHAIRLMAAFDQINNHKITNINVLGDNGDPQMDFAYITDKKRYYVFGVFPGDEEYDAVTKSVHWTAREDFRDHCENVWQYASTKLSLPISDESDMKLDLSAVTVWSPESEAPGMVLLTNLEESHKTILDRYLYYFAGVAGHRQASHTDASASFISGSDGLDEYTRLGQVFAKFGNYLTNYISREYFLSTQVNMEPDSILNLQGSLVAGKAVVEVGINPPEGNVEFVSKLNKAIENINMRKIYDSQHRVLRFFVK